MDEVLQLARWAEERPCDPALLAPGLKCIPFCALPPLLENARRAFRASGLGPREVAAVTMQPGFESLLALLAVTEESACAPLDPSLPRDEFKRDLARIGASTLVVQGAAESPAVAAAREMGLRVLRVTCSSGGASHALAVETVLPRVSARAPRYTGAALLLLTSSTTGNPKLVPATAANMRARLNDEGLAHGIGPGDRCLTLLPLFHLQGLLTALRQLMFGGSIACTPGFDPKGLVSWWREFRPTWFSAGVPMLHAIAATAPADWEVFAAAPPRFIRVTGASPDQTLRETVEKIMCAPLLVGYGLSEAGSVACNRINASKPGSVGYSMGARIVISDETGNLLAPGEEGEILLQGPTITPGYCDDEEANLQAFRNGWFHTGDLGRLDVDGFLYITGRRKEIINRGGEKILPTDIDHVLAGHPAVKEAAAFAVPHRTLGEDVAAAVVLQDGVPLTAADLRRYAAGRLAAFKIPRLIVFVDAIPRTASGKPKRALLASQFGTAKPRGSATGEPASDVEQRIIRIWSRVLKDRDFTSQDDFMLRGGDSLSAAGMLVEVDKEFHTQGRLLARADFFAEPTVEALARIVLECGPFSAECNPEPEGILALAREGDGVPLFCFPGWRGGDGEAANWYYVRHLAAGMAGKQPFYVVTVSLSREGARSASVEELAGRSIEAIRGAQPHGPYVFAGHCLGAVVAFEAARQLISQGEQVLQLFLFDAVAPGYPRLASNWRRYVAELSRVVRELDGKAAWSHLCSYAQLLGALIVGKLRRIGAALGLKSLNTSLLNHRRGAALWQYEPGGCPVPMVHFIAADQPVSRVLDDPRYGWRDVARAGIGFRIVPGDHYSMFSAENAPSLAAEIHALLEPPVLAPQSVRRTADRP